MCDSKGCFYISARGHVFQFGGHRTKILPCHFPLRRNYFLVFPGCLWYFYSQLPALGTVYRWVPRKCTLSIIKILYGCRFFWLFGYATIERGGDHRLLMILFISLWYISLFFAALDHILERIPMALRAENRERFCAENTKRWEISTPDARCTDFKRRRVHTICENFQPLLCQMASDNKETTSSFSPIEYIFSLEDAFESKKQTVGSKLPLIKCTYSVRKIMMSLSVNTHLSSRAALLFHSLAEKSIDFKCVCIKNAANWISARRERSLTRQWEHWISNLSL